MKTKHRNQIVKLPPEKAQALHRAMKPVFRQFATYLHIGAASRIRRLRNGGTEQLYFSAPAADAGTAHEID